MLKAKRDCLEHSRISHGDNFRLSLWNKILLGGFFVPDHTSKQKKLRKRGLPKPNTQLDISQPNLQLVQRELDTSAPVSPHNTHYLQRTIGNRATARLLSGKSQQQALTRQPGAFLQSWMKAAE